MFHSARVVTHRHVSLYSRSFSHLQHGTLFELVKQTPVHALTQSEYSLIQSTAIKTKELSRDIRNIFVHLHEGGRAYKSGRK